MNNHRLLTGLLAAILSSGGVCVNAQKVYSIEELFEIAETNSTQLRAVVPQAEEEARKEISVARNGRLPEIEASLSLSYIGDGFITKRNFSGFSRKPRFPHFGNGLAVNITQPSLYRRRCDDRHRTRRTENYGRHALPPTCSATIPAFS